MTLYIYCSSLCCSHLSRSNILHISLIRTGSHLTLHGLRYILAFVCRGTHTHLVLLCYLTSGSYEKNTFPARKRGARPIYLWTLGDLPKMKYARCVVLFFPWHTGSQHDHVPWTNRANTNRRIQKQRRLPSARRRSSI